MLLLLLLLLLRLLSKSFKYRRVYDSDSSHSTQTTAAALFAPAFRIVGKFSADFGVSVFYNRFAAVCDTTGESSLTSWLLLPPT
jgi:hypothetical protein